MKKAESQVNPAVERGIRKFLESMRGERNASQHTLRAYGNELMRFG